MIITVKKDPYEYISCQEQKSTDKLLLRFIIRIKITKAEVERNEDKILDRVVLHFQLAELNNINFHNDWRKLDTVQIREEVFFSSCGINRH